MNKGLAIAVSALIVAAGGLFIWNGGSLPSPLPAKTPILDNLIRISIPKPGDIIKSPVHIEGEARGNWYFEASFPVKIIDADGNILGQMPAQAQRDWMTTEFVPFKADLTFKEPATAMGFLILEKDNPSGLPQNADERKIPIKFSP